MCLTNMINKIYIEYKICIINKSLFIVLILNLCIPCNQHIKYKHDISLLIASAIIQLCFKKSNMQLEVEDLYLI